MKKVDGFRRNEAPAGGSSQSKFLLRLRLVEEAALGLFVFGVVLVIVAGSLPPRSLTGSNSGVSLSPDESESEYDYLAHHRADDGDALASLPISQFLFQRE